MSALVDGQLDPAIAERLWQHVAECDDCAGAVEAEEWVKRRMAGSRQAEAPSRLIGSLCSLPARADHLPRPAFRQPGRRRRYLLAGAGSVSAALVSFAALSGGVPSAAGPGISVDPPADGSQPVVTSVSSGGDDQFMSVVFVTP